VDEQQGRLPCLFTLPRANSPIRATYWARLRWRPFSLKIEAAAKRRLATREGWRYQLVQPIIVAIDQYPEAARLQALPIFHYWFARCAVELWVRLRKPGCARWRVRRTASWY
jgi:hypothetical protein